MLSKVLPVDSRRFRMSADDLVVGPAHNNAAAFRVLYKRYANGVT